MRKRFIILMLAITPVLSMAQLPKPLLIESGYIEGVQASNADLFKLSTNLQQTRISSVGNPDSTLSN